MGLSGPSHKISSPNSWPLVGRSSELATCERVLADGRGVLLAGPAGIGKTVLARALASSLGDASQRTASPGRNWDPSWTTVTPGFGLPLDRVPVSRTGVDPALIVVDDANRLDEDAAALLHHRVVTNEVLLVATMRTGTSPPSALTALWKDGFVERIDLDPLDRSEVDEALDTFLQAPVDNQSRLRIWEASQGSPLVLRELIRSSLDDGQLTLTNGIWLLDGHPESSRLDEIFSHRMAGLNDEGRQVLELLALGEPIGLELMLAYVELPSLLQVEEAGLIEIGIEGGRSEIRLGHPLFGDMALAAIGPLRIIEHHRLLLSMLASTPMRRNDDIVRATSWQVRAGGKLVTDDMVLAARRALYSQDHRLAIELATRAFDNRSPDAALVLSEALVESGDPERAASVLETIDNESMPKHTALVAMQRAVALFWGLGEGDLADHILVEAIELLPPGEWRDEVAAERAVIAANRGQIRLARKLAEPHLTPSSGGRAFATACIAGACAAAFDGRPEQAKELATAGFEARSSLGDLPVMAHAGVFVIAYVVASTEAGDFREGEILTQAVYEQAAEEGNSEGQAWFSITLADIRLRIGHLDSACQLFVESAGSFAALHANGQRRWALAGAVMAAALSSTLEETESFWAELQEIGDHPATIVWVELERAGAWLEAKRGHTSEAIELLRTIAERALSDGMVSHGGSALHDIIRLGGTVSTEAWGPLADSEGSLGPLRCQLGESVKARDASSLEGIAERFVELGSPLYAAETLLRAAEFHQRQGQPRAASRCRRLAHEYQLELGVESILTLDQTRSVQALTRRESEVAKLAARGEPSLEIASKLGISVRTVENHLQRTYEKIGVSGRSELADALGAPARG